MTCVHCAVRTNRLARAPHSTYTTRTLVSPRPPAGTRWLVGATELRNTEATDHRPRDSDFPAELLACTTRARRQPRHMRPCVRWTPRGGQTYRKSARTQGNSSPQWRCTGKGEDMELAGFYFFLLKFPLCPSSAPHSSILSSACCCAVPSRIQFTALQHVSSVMGAAGRLGGVLLGGKRSKNSIRLKIPFLSQNLASLWYQLQI